MSYQLTCRTGECKAILVGHPSVGQLHALPKIMGQQENGSQCNHATSKHLPNNKIVSIVAIVNVMMIACQVRTAAQLLYPASADRLTFVPLQTRCDTGLAVPKPLRLVWTLQLHYATSDACVLHTAARLLHIRQRQRQAQRQTSWA